jgi:hypothetical protein
MDFAMTCCEQAITDNSRLFKDFPHYLACWCYWGGIGGLMSPVYVKDEYQRYGVMLYQTIFGVLCGAAVSVLFTVLQNRINVTHRRSISWTMAAVLWLVARFGVVAVLL